MSVKRYYLLGSDLSEKFRSGGIERVMKTYSLRYNPVICKEFDTEHDAELFERGMKFTREYSEFITCEKKDYDGAEYFIKENNV